MRYQLKVLHTDENGFNSLSELSELSKTTFLDQLIIDFSECSFFDANMAAPLYAILTKYYERLNEVSIANCSKDVEEILRRNHFLLEFSYPALYDGYQSTLPFKKFKQNAGEQFNDYLNLYLLRKGMPKMSEMLTKKFKQSLFELFKNAELHSNSKSGIFVCGQHYNLTKKLSFTISDAGVGIHNNVSKFLKKEISDIDSIKWALEEGNSTRENEQPGGIGLKLIKNFIKLNGGKIQIVSGLGYYEFSNSNEHFRTMKHSFPGTCVNIEINANDSKSYYLKSELNSADIF